MKPIVLLGVNESGEGGQLAYALWKYYRDKSPICRSFEELDLTNHDAVAEFIRASQPRLVINATAYTAVDLAEREVEKAFDVNARAVEHLAKLCAEVGVTLVHYSTDYVFDGENPDGYREDATPHPINVYGESKFAGEEAIRALCPAHYILRTSWLYGPRGKNFVTAIVNKARTTHELRVVNDQIGTPNYTIDLVRYTDYVLSHVVPYGTYHLGSFGQCSWADFAKEIVGSLGLDVAVIGIPSSEYPTAAKRPHYSRLLNTKLKTDIERPWQDALREFMAEEYPA